MLKSPTVLTVLGTLVIGSAAMTAAAAQPRIVTRDSVQPKQAMALDVHESSSDHVFIVKRQVVEPSTVVDRALSQQPVHPHLVEVRVDHSTIYLDPDVDYLRKNKTTMTERNYLTSAIQYHGDRARSAKIVRNERVMNDSEMHASNQAQMVIYKPDFLDRDRELVVDQVDRRIRPRPRVKMLAPIPKVRVMPKKIDIPVGQIALAN